MHKRIVLLILDGWGIAKDSRRSAIAAAYTPCMDKLWQRYPHSHLIASGESIGLPAGQMGNSEVGHMHIGAGRVVDQDLVRIDKAIANASFHKNPRLLEAFSYAQKAKKKVHMLGLASSGGIHSHMSHLIALCEAAAAAGIAQVYVHAFSDGRDTDKFCAADDLAYLETQLNKHGGQVASIIGRYYAMDRDKRWERTYIAYEALTKGKGLLSTDLISAIRKAYKDGQSDEFLLPLIAQKSAQHQKPLATIAAGDMVIAFNFRSDRMRQLTRVLTQEDMPKEGMHKMPLHMLTMTSYDDTFQDIAVLYKKAWLQDTLGEILAKAGKKQARIAETEKYPHITFFFSGGREAPFAGEERMLCPSPKVATYDLKPEMSIHEVTAHTLSTLQGDEMDFVCINFANPDMVGHTGHFEAAVKACEVVDACTAQVIQMALERQYACMIIADHGNVEEMKHKDGSPHTTHTTHLVPCIWVDDSYKGTLKDGTLADVAPSILHAMGLPIPKAMSGRVLL